QTAGHPELHHAPIIPGSAASPRFPAIHPLAVLGVAIGNEDRGARVEERLLRREKLVARRQNLPAHAFRSEIGKARKAFLIRTAVIRVMGQAHGTAPILFPEGPVRKVPCSKIFVPRRKVASILPQSSLPA